MKARPSGDSQQALLHSLGAEPERGDTENSVFLGRGADTFRRHADREQHKARMRQARLLRIAMLLAGAAFGVVVDVSVFGPLPIDAAERVICSLFLGAICGGLVYVGVLSSTVRRGLRNPAYAAGDVPRHFDPSRAPSAWSFAATAASATYLAAGHSSATVHSYTCVLGCQLVLLLAFRRTLFVRPEPRSAA